MFLIDDRAIELNNNVLALKIELQLGTCFEALYIRQHDSSPTAFSTLAAKLLKGEGQIWQQCSQFNLAAKVWRQDLWKTCPDDPPPGAVIFPELLAHYSSSPTPYSRAIGIR